MDMVWTEEEAYSMDAWNEGISMFLEGLDRPSNQECAKGWDSAKEAYQQA